MTHCHVFMQACSIWMPLDPVSEKSTIEFVAGSHRYNVSYRPKKFATTYNYPVLIDGTDQEYVDVPDIDKNREQYNIVKWSVEAGLCVHPTFSSEDLAL